MRAWPIAPLVLAGTVVLGASAAAQDFSGEYSIGPKDLVQISVLEIPELNVERHVSDRGTIDLPLVGELPVSDLTPKQVQARLETLLTAKYVNRANVSVLIKEYGSKPVSIVGAIRSPGSLRIAGRWSLLQAISAAGGLTESAGRKIYVLRRAENGLSDSLEIRTEELFRGSSPVWNIPIFPSDVVNIPARSTVIIYCLGQVKQPGALSFDRDDRLSILSVIARAGGLTDRASSRIRIKRHGAEGKDVELVVDFKRVLSGKDPDPVLKPDDVVVVKESFF